MSVTVATLFDLLRKLVLSDDEIPYRWSNTELIYALNRAFSELIKIPMTKDQTTAAIVEILLLSNQTVYARDSRILQIQDARLETNKTAGSLIRTTEEYLNKSRRDWRSLIGTYPTHYIPEAYSGYLSIYPKFDDEGEIQGASNISFVSGTKTISGADFTEIDSGDQFVITGTTNNNNTFTAASDGTATSIVTVEALTTEANTSALIRKVRDTLLLSVTRHASSRFTEANITDGTTIPVLRDEMTDGLLDGMGKFLWLKPDVQTYYPAKAQTHSVTWEQFKKDIRRDLILLNKPDKSRKPRSGTSIYY